MRVDWKQSLEGCSLLEIRNILRAIGSADSSFSTEFVATRLQGSRLNRAVPTAETGRRAKRLMDGLIVSGLAKVDEEARKPARDWFVLTEAGMSLRSATAMKRLSRERADAALPKLLTVVQRINEDPIFLHDIVWVAVFGSYLGNEPDLGDIDVAIEKRARWALPVGDDSDRDRRRKIFEKVHPPPESFYEKGFWRFWPETYADRILRVDKALAIIERSQLDTMGCAYRQLFPVTRDFAAKPDWSCERREIVLKPDDGSAIDLIEQAFERAKINAARRRAENEAFLKRFKKQRHREEQILG
jgi:hypothetical protein